MTTVAIIPARGGSKRLPGKNIKLLAGKPLIAWTIEAAVTSNCFDKVIVSTECEEIADIGLKYGAEVPCLRPRELGEDSAPTSPVLEHMVGYIESTQRLKVDTVCLLQPTSLLRTSGDIKESKSLFDLKSADAVVSVSQSEVKPSIMNSLPENGSLKGFISDFKRIQDSEKLYQLNGAIYWMKRELVFDMLKIYKSENSFAYLMDRESSIDIDTEFDFLLAEFFLAQKN